jgi:DnaJ-domain-containing protein 1
MFERQRTSATAPEMRILVTLTLNEGEVMRGTVRLPLSGRLVDAVNNADQFLDIETLDGDRLFIAKHSVRKVETFEIPRSDQLSRRSARTGTFDPYEVLGLPKGATAEAVREAYLHLARIYHPDRFAGLELPKEVHDYANAMLTRINVAYQQLEA